MRRMDVGLAIGAGLLLVLVAVGISALGLVVFAPLMAVLGVAIDTWYVGAAAAIASFLLRRRPESRGLSRALGIVGVAWITFVVGFYLALSLIFLLASA